MNNKHHQSLSDHSVPIHEHTLFFSEDLSEDVITLSAEETNHAANVLRISPGTCLLLTDGKGVRATGVYDSVHNHRMVVPILSRSSVNKPVETITFCIALPERDAFENILSAATALGISGIVPMNTDHCRKPWWKDWNKWQDRFRKKMIVTLKQSCGNFIPELSTPVSADQAIREFNGCGLVADPDGLPLKDCIATHRPQPYTCFIGPPGGFSNRERDLFIQCGLPMVKIAENRLRTELAATVLIAQLTGMQLQGTSTD